MPTKTSTKPETPRATTKKEAPAPLTPAVEAKPEKFSGFVQKWRENVDHRLTRYLKDFVDDAMPEEKAFMLEVLCRWESNTCGGRLRGFNEHEIPLLSAISNELNGQYLVPVDSEHMVREVEEFITAKLAAGWKEPKRDYTYGYCEDPKEGDARIRQLLLRHVDHVTHKCRREDMNFLSDVLEQWEAIMDNEDLRDGTPHRMAAAAEIHLDVIRRAKKPWGPA